MHKVPKTFLILAAIPVFFWNAPTLAQTVIRIPTDAEPIRAPSADAPASNQELQPQELQPQEADSITPPVRPPKTKIQVRTVGNEEVEGESESKILAAQFHKSDETRIEAAKLKGVQPGTTTLQQLKSLWAAPNEVEDHLGMERRVYYMKPFEEVEVLVDQGVVRAITIMLRNPHPAAALTKDLSLDTVEPVVIKGDGTEVLGHAFPERGVMFTAVPGSTVENTKVKQIVLEKVQPEPFLLRAESNFRLNHRQSLADVEQALKLAPNYPQAQWLEARIHLKTGQYGKALTSIDKVVHQEPMNPEYRLTRAKIHEQRGDYPRAITDTQEAISGSKQRPDLMALATCRLGDLIAESPAHDFTKAIEHHQEALKLAPPLLSHQQVSVRNTGVEVLLRAHLGVACDIAWGRWKSKDQVVPKWISRAKKIADSADADEQTKAQYQFLVARRALWAHLGMQEPIAEINWAEEAVKYGNILLEDTKDVAQRSELQWELGLALNDAMQIYLDAKQFEDALKYGVRGVQLLEQTYEHNRQKPGAEYQMGRLYFRVGSVYMIRQKDYKRAITWYEKALPMLEKPIPISALGDIGRQGETLVTIAVALWNNNQQKEAIKLTTKGLELMESASRDGILKESALAVPYRNLAEMHRFLGNQEEAQNYERLVQQNKSKLQR